MEHAIKACLSSTKDQASLAKQDLQTDLSISQVR